MKTRLLRTASIGYTMALLTVGCNNNSSNTTSAPLQNVDSVRQDKTQVFIDTAEASSYRRNEEEMIRKNNEKIAELKEEIRKEKRAVANDYNTQLDTLNQENLRMEMRLKKFSKTSKTDWESFKYDFNRDMDSLGKSISRFAERNMSNKNK